MKESIKIFENARFGQIRTSVMESGEPLFCLADLCKSINVANHRNVAKRIDKDDVRRMDVIDNMGRNQQVLFVTESGMYEVLVRSDSEEAKPFRKWVCSEVLPSIRKSGGYMVAKVDETPEQIMARALMVAKDTIERHAKQLEVAKATITSQSEQLKLQAPKVEYIDNVLNSVNTYTSTQVAKDLNLRTAEQLHNILRDWGVMIRQSGQWMLSAKHCEHEYTKTRTHLFTRQDGTQGTSNITVWTEKGRLFLHQLFTQKGGQQ